MLFQFILEVQKKQEEEEEGSEEERELNLTWRNQKSFI